MIFNINKEYFNTCDAEYYLQNEKGVQITVKTLRTLVTRGGGPKFYKWGRSVYYTKQTLDDWVKSRMSELKNNSLDKGVAQCQI